MFILGGFQRAEPVLEEARMFGSKPKLEQVPFHVKLTLLSQSALRADPEVGATGRRAVPSQSRMLCQLKRHCIHL